MKITTYVIVIFLIVLVLIGIRESGFLSNVNNSEITDNINQGTITLFSQNYSEVNSVPSNVFIGKIENTTTLDNVHSTMYRNEKSEIFLDNTSKELVYATTRSSNGSSTPLVSHADERLKKGSLYICNFTPMFKCTYEISMGINTDNPRSYVELYSPGSMLVIHKVNNNTVLRSYFQNVSGNIKSKTITIGNADKSNLKIVFDGENKTNTIIAESGSYITTPFYKLDRQRLPYIDFSNGYIKFISFIDENGKYLDVNLFSINQEANRKLITPIGDSKMIAYGLDGPYSGNLTEQGIIVILSINYTFYLWIKIFYPLFCER